MKKDTKQDFIKECLRKIDSKEKLTEREIRDLLEYEVMQSEGEDRRWSRSNTSIVEVNNRYFMIVWEQGLTENCDDAYMDQPVEVFNPKYKTYTGYRTSFFTNNGTLHCTINGLLNEHIEEDKT